jgi:hypothetical protein
MFELQWYSLDFGIMNGTKWNLVPIQPSHEKMLFSSFSRKWPTRESAVLYRDSDRLS